MSRGPADNETFYGYCFPEPDGWHTPPVTLNSPEEVFRYTQLHGRTGMFREVRITDGGDNLVVQMVDGQYTWPEEWKSLNSKEEKAIDEIDRNRAQVGQPWTGGNPDGTAENV